MRQKTALLLLCVFMCGFGNAFSQTANSKTYLPFLDNTTGVWHSIIILNNVGTTSASAKITLYDESGKATAPKTVTMSSLQRKMLLVDDTTFTEAPRGYFYAVVELSTTSVTIFGVILGEGTETAGSLITINPVSDPGNEFSMPLAVDIFPVMTYVALSNLEGKATSITPIQHEYGGSPDAKQSFVLSDFNVQRRTLTEFFGPTIGPRWCQFQSDQTKLLGGAIYRHDHQGRYGWGAVSLPSPRLGSFSLPYLRQLAGKWETYISLTNYETAAAEVTLSLLNPDGTQVGSSKIVTLNAAENKMLTINDQSFGAVLGDGEYFTVIGYTANNVAAQLAAVNNGTTRALDFIVSEPLAPRSAKIVIPYAVSNEGMETRVWLFNPSPQSNMVKLTACSSDGKKLSEKEIAMGPGSTIFQNVNDLMSGLSGEPWIIAETSYGSVTGQIFYATRIGGDQVWTTQPALVVTPFTDPSAITVTATPASCHFNEPLTVNLTSSSYATILYTTDGTIPSLASPRISGPLQLTATTTLKFRAVDYRGFMGPVQTEYYPYLENYSDMSIIPAGTFTMGTDDTSAEADEHPSHQVTLNTYAIDRYEVSNEQFAAFLSGGGVDFHYTEKMRITRVFGGSGKFEYTAIPGEENHPVTNVTWSAAVAYSNWAGKRLPYEAEWERAARSTDERKYPWGNTAPDVAVHANYNDPTVGAVKARGTYAAGKSADGLYDLAGNVWEWCYDRYDSAYYSSSPASNPTGPTGGTNKVLRGGSYKSDADGIRCTNRASNPGNGNEDYGFRCVKIIPASLMDNLKKEDAKNNFWQ